MRGSNVLAVVSVGSIRVILALPIRTRDADFTAFGSPSVKSFLPLKLLRYDPERGAPRKSARSAKKLTKSRGAMTFSLNSARNAIPDRLRWGLCAAAKFLAGEPAFEQTDG